MTINSIACACHLGFRIRTQKSSNCSIKTFRISPKNWGGGGGGGVGGHDKTIYRGIVIKEGLGKFAELSGGRPGKKH